MINIGKVYNLYCSACGRVFGCCRASATQSRFKFYCSKKCIQLKVHRLKTNENKEFHNMVDTSTESLKNILGLRASDIPADFRIAMFEVFKTRQLIKRKIIKQALKQAGE